MDLISMANSLMPAGKPKYLEVARYPKISSLIEREGYKKMLAVLTLMVKDFCSSVNVVRNMNEDQMIEAGAMLLEECGNFRMEDYLMMFTMAKRGSFDEVKIYDRIDIQLISKIMDAYWDRRHAAGKRAQEEQVQHLDTLGPLTRKIEHMNPEQARLMEGADRLSAAMGSIAASMKVPDVSEQELKKDIRPNSTQVTWQQDDGKGNSGFQKVLP